MAPLEKNFVIRGMHCASCVRTIERALLDLTGVREANVNLASEQAAVTYDPAQVTPERLAAAIRSVGYEASVREESLGEDTEKAAKERELRDLKQRLVVGLVLSGLIVWGSLPYLIWSPYLLQSFYLQLLLAFPVQFWVGATFYRATLPALKHRTANMDTLVVIGTTVAFVYSLVVTAFPTLLNSWGLNRSLTSMSRR